VAYSFPENFRLAQLRRRGAKGYLCMQAQSIFRSQGNQRESSVTNSERNGAEAGYECDALVVGSGCAGLSAAVTAGHRGLNILIVEKEPKFGGGQDSAFGKGSRAYNRFQGDALHGPNPCIGPVEQGPFYAIKMVIGDLGTYAGIKTDANARALDGDAQAIDGLYAAGNDMASIMGGNYPGAGITLARP
jgi:succinate dehydrogenase/fumarate reductase flavoprotein subunit